MAKPKAKKTTSTRTQQSKAAPRRTGPAAANADEEDENETETENEGGMTLAGSSAPIDGVINDDDDDEEEDEDEDEDDDDEEEMRALPPGQSNKPRREGGKKAKRDIIFNVAANVTLQEDHKEYGAKGEVALVMDEIEVTKPTEGSPFDLKKAREEVVKIFEQRWHEKPERISAPAYRRKGMNQPRVKRESISFNKIAEQVSFISKKGSAVHKGWEVLVQFTDHDDVVYIQYKQIANEEYFTAQGKDPKKVQKPSPKYLDPAKLQNLREATKSSPQQQAQK